MAPLTLYFLPRTRATRPVWLLEELAERGGPIPYELVRLDVAGGAHKRPEYRRIHPLGLVPALLDGEQAIFESLAICLHLADRFIERGLAPPLGSSLRGRYYTWMAFASATLEPALSDFARHGVKLPEAERVAEIAERARRGFDRAARALAAELERAPFLLGAELSAADVIVGSDLIWASQLGLLDSHATLADYATRLRERPAALRAFAIS